jgi:hypothetical protein
LYQVMTCAGQKIFSLKHVPQEAPVKTQHAATSIAL